jgi:hypothetical protein
VFSYFTAGIPTFRLLSPLMVYSVLLYIGLLVFSYFNVGNILFTLFEKNNDFLTYTLNFLLLDAVIVSCCVPVLFWLDCPKYVRYLNRWTEVQVTFINISLIIRSINVLVYIIVLLLIPVAAQSKKWVCSLSLARIAVSTPTGGSDVFVLRVLYFIRYRSLGRVNHPSRGVLSTVVCLSRIVKPR